LIGQQEGYPCYKMFRFNSPIGSAFEGHGVTWSVWGKVASEARKNNWRTQFVFHLLTTTWRIHYFIPGSKLAFSTNFPP